ncbi:nuclear speckle splicing regulatory protein 1-like [Silurus meridionalis]|nr:nuclear speckle splicing regulatory protein 1-like [Silurus meridionalis]
MVFQRRLEMQKALDEDSSVYEYDSVYDDIQKQRLERNKKLLGVADRKPKYITQLMRALEERKKEQERRNDRKIQKQREAEGERFGNKEAYVTSAYKQKLKEREEELEREKRASEIEATLDVKKQKDLSGFYRHLLNQTVGEEALPDRSADRKEKSKRTIEPSALRGNDSPKAEFSKSGGNSSHSKWQYHQRTAKRAENAAQTNAAEPSKYTKRSNEQTVSSARERYLARQMSRSAVKSYVEEDEVLYLL